MEQVDRDGSSRVLIWRNVPAREVIEWRSTSSGLSIPRRATRQSSAVWSAPVVVFGMGGVLLAAAGLRALTGGRKDGWLLIALGSVLGLVATGCVWLQRRKPEQRITVDLEQGAITFAGLRPWNQFWLERPVERAECSLSEVRSLELVRGRFHEFLFIDTAAGRFLIRSGTENFDRLYHMLREVCPDGPVGHQRYNAKIWMICGATLVVFFLLLGWVIGVWP